VHEKVFRKRGRWPGHSPPRRLNRLPNGSIANDGRPAENRLCTCRASARCFLNKHANYSHRKTYDENGPP
jgi:hypothetical protein